MCLYGVVTYARFVFVYYANNTDTPKKRKKLDFIVDLRTLSIISVIQFYILIFKFYPRDFAID